MFVLCAASCLKGILSAHSSHVISRLKHTPYMGGESIASNRMREFGGMCFVLPLHHAARSLSFPPKPPHASITVDT
jgi:hypothetical protein